MATFAELGIPFPLFEADTSEATEYRGLGVCLVCAAQDAHCFRIQTVPVTCPACDAETWLDVPLHNPPTVAGECGACHRRLPGGLGVACYACLRAGRVFLGKDTELGMVGLEEARAGITHGVPGWVLTHPDVELVPLPPSASGEEEEEAWVQASVASDHLFELIRTPTYATWQGERWLFCCGKPMIYRGAWTPAAFAELAPGGDWRAFFARVAKVDGEFAAELLRGIFDSALLYVFCCQRCATLRAHVDFA